MLSLIYDEMSDGVFLEKSSSFIFNIISSTFNPALSAGESSNTLYIIISPFVKLTISIPIPWYCPYNWILKFDESDSSNK